MWGGARACRVCLAGAGAGAALLPAPRAARLLRAYEQAAGLPFQEECGMPRQLCYMCAALLAKFSIFRKKCRRSHFLLRAIYDAHDEITDEEIAKIDREASKLTSPYTISNLVSFGLDPSPSIEVAIIKNEDPYESTEFLEECIEKEKILAFSPLQDDSQIHDSDDASMQDESMKIKLDKDKEKKIKPTNKPKKERKKIQKKKETISPEDTVVTEESIVTEGTLPEKVNPPKKEKTHGLVKYPKSFYEKFATITYLTRKQQLEEIQKRQETSNYKNSPLKCTLCFKGFLEESTFKNHMVRHDLASGDFECDICRRRFKASRFLSHHYASIHMHRYTCKECRHVCTSGAKARLHEKWHKGTSYQCPHCNDSFLKSTSYLSHIRIKHPSQFVCEMCGNAFVSKKGIMQHKNLAHRDELPPTQGPFCSECDIRFASEDAYKKHLLSSAKHNLTSDRTFTCDDCKQTFEQRTELHNHMRDEHGSAPANRQRRRCQPRTALVHNKYPRKCDQCSLEVTSGRDYWMHFRRAHKGQYYPKQADKFICDLCGKGFQEMTLLVYHHRHHSGEKPYKCTVCDRSFMMNSYLVKHMYMHTGDMPFVCGICGKGFRTKGNLSRHIMIHTGDKSYPCEYCEKKFCTPSDLKTHFTHSHLKVPWPKRKNPRGSRKCGTTTQQQKTTTTTT